MFLTFVTIWMKTFGKQSSLIVRLQMCSAASGEWVALVISSSR